MCCGSFADLAKQSRKNRGGVSEVGNINFSILLFVFCVGFLFFTFYFTGAREMCEAYLYVFQKYTLYTANMGVWRQVWLLPYSYPEARAFGGRRWWLAKAQLTLRTRLSTFTSHDNYTKFTYTTIRRQKGHFWLVRGIPGTSH